MESIRHHSGERVFFLSDVHLGGHDAATEALKTGALDGFFHHLSDSAATSLYIVGDLWDFGFEYRHCLPKEMIWSLSRLTFLIDNGLRVHFLGGNHDFWIRDFLVESVGLIYHDGPVALELDGGRWFLAHGDGISSDDTGYRLLRGVLRSRVLVALYRLIHPDIGIPLAKWVAGLGKTDREADPDFPDLESVARRKVEREGFQGAIFGHRHYPKDEAIAGGRIIVLGDWIRWFSYLSYIDGRLRLNYWPVEGRAEGTTGPPSGG